MRHRLCGTAAAIAGVWLAAVPATGQTPPKTQTAGTVATAGKWTPARTPDGQPDIQGMWEGGAGFEEQGVERIAVRPGPENNSGIDCKVGSGVYTECAAYVPLFTGYVDGKPNFGRPSKQPTSPPRPRGFVDVPDGKLPWTPRGAAKRADLMQHLFNPPSLEYVDPDARCMLAGIPQSGPGGYQFLQIPGYVVILQEFNHVSRIIPLDGRPHIGPDIRLFMGDSVGRWEGTTLVVDSTNFTGTAWFQMTGSAPQSDAVHLIERFTPVDADTIDYLVTVDDPKMFTRTWSFAGSFTRTAPAEAQGVQTIELLENACAEGSRALENIMERPSRPLPPEKLLPR